MIMHVSFTGTILGSIRNSVTILPSMKVGIGKGADAITVNRGLDLAGRGENRGNPGRAIP